MTPHIAPEDALAVDPAGIARYLAARLPQYGGEFGVTRLGEGQSCLTFMLEGEGWRVVLRRPPRGDLPPSAFDVTREYRVMSALHSHDAPVPVPPPVALCTDTGVIGAPFYLMEPVNGLVVRTELPEALSSMDDRARMARALVDTLVALQSIDYRAAGLEGFGKPEGYLERQLRRMNQLWELARFRDLPDIEAVGKWLSENIPSQRRATIVHGDYKLDNVIFAPESPARLVAVVDWEMSTIGDPLADLGWMLYWWRDPGDPSFGLTVSSVMDQEGFPRRRELLQAYAGATGEDVSAIDWYAALGGWKIAIIMEGSYRRFQAGITDHPLFKELEWGVPALAARSAAAMRGELGLR
ncbi:MAG TPA: phosphotransferase family protein [Actinomycetota bacterium]|nr:phosphotransferase family protein [Actinomycetota bacterium]